MAGCSLVAPGLAATVSGQQPTFSYDVAKHSSDYFGVQMTYLQGTSTCYGVNSIPKFTPIIQNTAAGFTRICQFLTTTSYTGIFCAGAQIPALPSAGPLTITFKGYTGGASTAPIPFTALFGPEPDDVTSTSTIGTTTTKTITTSVPAEPVATDTAFRASSTTSKTTTVSSTYTVTTPTTISISSCPTTSTTTSSTSSSRSSSSSSSTVTTPSSTSSSSSSTSSPSSSSTSAGPTASALSCPGSDGTTVRTPPGEFLIECYYDRFDSNIGIASPQPATFRECIEDCAVNDVCQAVSYVPNGSCYLKSAAGEPTYNSGIWGARLKSIKTAAPLLASTSSTTTAATQPTSTIACPAANGKIITSGTGRYQVECSIDRTDSDIGGPTYPGTYEACLANCDKTSGCVQISYIPGGPCYLKNGVGFPNPSVNVIGGRLLSGTQVASTIPATTSAPSSTTTAGPSVVTVTTTISNTKYQCACVPSGVPLAGNSELTCPLENGATYTTPCGAVYAIECGSDRYGNDIPGGIAYVNTLNDCINACSITPGCVDVSFVPGTPGPCYLKNSIGAIRQNSNVWGGRQISGCSVQVKVHRKRVTHPIAKHDDLKELQKRANNGIAYGPDFTYITSTTTVRSTTTTTSLTTTTTTPAKSGTTTTTSLVLATTTITTTTSVPTTVYNTVSVTSCPKMAAMFN